ncbi:hypothetical protein D9758_007179 [Tetrapyrgos nigripes]|uniref:Cell cycle checkpoint control protein RAD9A n=1 Tax=Tetrapyrgos nigripes TaxID=182062 RepID=A0A8H5D0T3_9AGAR|nr:hypothetical protein D9758_007179 [Tetrapyrgos nigripes]
MQVTFDSAALRPFTRALLCLSKYGEELTIYATTDVLSLSCTNSSKSAYGRFRYSKEFFSRYRLGASTADPEGIAPVTGQLTTRSLLSILKHRTVDSTLERCEISIVESVQDPNSNSGNTAEDGEDGVDGLENKLVVRLHCKHGVIKTHKLNLNTPNTLLAPGAPDPANESLLSIGPQKIKDIIEHFPLAKAAKLDPQLIWNFEETEVVVRSLESSLGSSGSAQLVTEMTMTADEFTIYDLYAVPTTIAFHLREFNATISFADASDLDLRIRFTDPTAPLFIDVEGDAFESLFVISTSQVQTSATQNSKMRRERSTSVASLRKRLREETPGGGETPRFKKPMKVVQPTDRESMARDTSMGPPRHSSFPLPATPLPPSSSPHIGRNAVPSRNQNQEPLFLPTSSQLSIMDESALKESGLGIEDMNPDEFNAMLEDEGEEVNYNSGDIDSDKIWSEMQLEYADADSAGPEQMVDGGYNGTDEIIALQPTQRHEGEEAAKTFYPLFED